MTPRCRSGWGALAAVVLVVMGIGLLAVYGWIELQVRRTGDSAAARFGGDRVEALTELVACESCSLKERNLAVWALGQVGDRRGLAVLRKYHTQAPCDHAVDLCQYELGKAIKKIEGTWDLNASLHYKGTDPTSP